MYTVQLEARDGNLFESLKTLPANSLLSYAEIIFSSPTGMDSADSVQPFASCTINAYFQIT